MLTTTILARSPASLLRSLAALQPSTGGPVLFSISPNLPPADLSLAINSITALAPRTLGCLSAPLPSHPGHIACALAFFPKSAVPFRSTLPGRSAPQVGRWHAFRGKDTEPEEEFSSWADARMGTRRKTALLDELKGIQPSGVIYLTDRAPEGLLSTFEHYRSPRHPAPTLGLVASSTPFITGRPVTLFDSGSIFESGAVGIALNDGCIRTLPSPLFSDCVSISERFRVTSCEGNMINELEAQQLGNHKPTELLLDAIRRRGLDMELTGSFKDDETFLVGTPYTSGNEMGDVSMVEVELPPTRMYHITAGDPTRGPLSLETQNIAPPENSFVKFYHLPKSTGPATLAASNDTSFKFITGKEADADIERSELEEGETVTLEGFMASSENGFVLKDREDAWTCTVPGGNVVFDVEG